MAESFLDSPDMWPQEAVRIRVFFLIPTCVVSTLLAFASHLASVHTPSYPMHTHGHWVMKWLLPTDPN